MDAFQRVSFGGDAELLLIPSSSSSSSSSSRHSSSSLIQEQDEENGLKIKQDDDRNNINNDDGDKEEEKQQEKQDDEEISFEPDTTGNNQRCVCDDTWGVDDDDDGIAITEDIVEEEEGAHVADPIISERAADGTASSSSGLPPLDQDVNRVGDYDQERTNGRDFASSNGGIATTGLESINNTMGIETIDEDTATTVDTNATATTTTIISGIDTLPRRKSSTTRNKKTLLSTLDEFSVEEGENDVPSDASAECLASPRPPLPPSGQKMKRATQKLMDRLFFASSHSNASKRRGRQRNEGGSGGGNNNITSQRSDGSNSSSTGQLQQQTTGGGEEHSANSDSNNPAGQRRRPLLQSSLSEMLQIQPLKKNMPERIREKREEQFRASRSLVSMSDPSSKGHAAPVVLYPTPLHELCADPEASMSDLVACLESDKQAIHVKDARGRLPLHVLGDCETRLSTVPGKKVATAFAFKLLEAHPEALVTQDAQGFFPFVSLIAEWMDWVFETYRKEKQARAAASPKISFPWRSSDEAMKPQELLASLFVHGTQGYLSRLRVFPKPDIWDEVEWCFTMLSLALDELGGKSGLFKSMINDKRDDFAGQHTANQQYVRKPDRIRRDVVCHLITVMPNLIKCVLMIPSEGGETRRRILKLSVFRRLFLCKESVGEWLTYMLRKQGVASRRAVDFLQLISETKVSDYTGGCRAITIEDVERFHAERGDVFNAVNELESTMGSLVVLENKETERAASTDVIWHIMGERLARPFVLGLVLVDLVLHIALMLAFRSTARTQQSRLADVPTKTVLTICAHYVIRKFCESAALFSVSPAVLRGYLGSVWTLFDLLSIAMTMAAFIYNEKNPGTYRNGFNAFVQGVSLTNRNMFARALINNRLTFRNHALQLLWMKVIGLLKVVNKDMSVSTKDDGAFCYEDDLNELREDLEGPTLDFCSKDLATSYLRIYVSSLQAPNPSRHL
eukprot:scaffold4442_cov125-Amphora_coffeaeformis.AAC.8